MAGLEDCGRSPSCGRSPDRATRPIADLSFYHVTPAMVTGPSHQRCGQISVEAGLSFRLCPRYGVVVFRDSSSDDRHRPLVGFAASVDATDTAPVISGGCAGDKRIDDRDAIIVLAQVQVLAVNGGTTHLYRGGDNCERRTLRSYSSSRRSGPTGSVLRALSRAARRCAARSLAAGAVSVPAVLSRLYGDLHLSSRCERHPARRTCPWSSTVAVVSYVFIATALRRFIMASWDCS